MITQITFLAAFVFSTPLFASELKVSSKAFEKGEKIQETQVLNNPGFGCSGKNISPDIQWSGADKKETKAYAITLFDPDAPTEGSGWWHWTIFNIPASATQLSAGLTSEADQEILKTAIQGRTDFGTTGYGGPCPPAGSTPHRYILRVYALKDFIPLDQNAPAAMVGFYINSLKIAQGTIKAKYNR